MANVDMTDSETSRKETKVRPRGYKHWQTHHSSAQAEEKIKKTYELFHVQQVRTEIKSFTTFDTARPSRLVASKSSPVLP
jgi:hypothetical protein